MDSRLQMNWQPNRRSRTRSAQLPPLGLRNLGNTCYLNSVLQCLTYTPPLGNFCLNSQHSSNCSFPPNCAFCIVEKRINRHLSLDLFLDSPFKIHNCIGLFADHFKRYAQEDAHEFLRYLIDACHNSCLKNDKVRGGGGGDGESVVKEIFGGELRSQVKCVSCGGESNKIDEIMDISLDIFEIDSVEEALRKFFEPEILNGANMYKCEKCEELVVAKKQMSILKAPNVLVIQLKRFDGINGTKIERGISFDEYLVLSNYMCKESQDPHPEYNLFGTIVHSGHSLDSGHYYAYVKDTIGRWYWCNDTIVSLSTLQEVLSKEVYILFFIRTNQRPRPTNSSSVANGVRPHSNGYDAQKAKEAVPGNSVEMRPHGAHNPEKVIPTISNTGEPPLDPRKKCDNSKSSDSKIFHGNGNAINNGDAENHIRLKEGKNRETIMKGRSLVNNLDCGTANESAGAVEPETKQNFLLPHENGNILGHSVKPMKTGRPEDAGLGHIVANGRTSDSGIVSQDEDSSTISGSKRKILDDRSNYSPSPDANHETYEIICEKLTKDAFSYLQSCGWYEDVLGSMRAKKKLYAQSGGDTTNDVELKKVLIEEARQTSKSQVPAALKANLVSLLNSFYQKNNSRRMFT